MSMACEFPWKTGEWLWLIWVAGFVRANQQLFSDSFRSFFFFFFETLLKSRFLQDSSALRCNGTGGKTS